MPFDPSATRSGSTFSDVPSYQAAFVCYINGVFVPIMGFQTEAAVWEIPSFTIHLVPDLRLQRLGCEDRVPVQIFALDYWFNPEKPQFTLLIDGEIVGWQQSSYAGRRSMAFTCLQHINVFEDLYFFYMTNVDDVIAAQSPEVMAQGFSEPGLMWPYALFHQGLLSTSAQIGAATPPSRNGPNTNTGTAPVTDPDEGIDAASPAAPIKAPYELLYNVIRGIIGTEVPNARRSVPMMNFFARHTRKTRLYQRFVRLPYLEDPERLADGKGVFPIFNAARNTEALNAMQRHLVSEIGTSGPVWELLKQVFGVVFMEIGMVTNPPAVIVELNSPSGPRQDGKILRILNNNTEPVVQQGALSEPTPDALQTRADELSRTIRAAVMGQASIDPAALTEAGYTSLPARIIEVDATQIRTHLERTARQRGDTSRTPPREEPARVEGQDTRQPIRLAQYFVKPEFLFGIPPHCNVIFPSMTTGFTYDESFKNQPTRTYVNDSVMTQLLRANGPNRHFLLHALSVGYPEEANALMEHKAGGDTESATTRATPAMMESGKNLLIWPEEFFAGPKTARFSVPKWLQMLRQFSNNQAQGEATPTGLLPAASAPTAPRTMPNVPGVPTPPVTGTAIPPTISEARRGMVFTRAQARPDFAYRWLITAEALAAGNRANVPYHLPRYSELTPRGLVQPRGSTERIPNYQQTPSSALRRLAAHLREIFGTVITHFEYMSGFPQPVTDTTRQADPHIAGRAVDIMFRTVRRGPLYSMPDLEHGNPIAEYLVQNAEVFGVQYLVWARSQWHGSKPAGVGPGKKFAHYARAPESERFDHFNHIHLELSLDAAQNNLPFYTRNSSSSTSAEPPRPARTVFGPPSTAGLITRLPTEGNAPAVARTIELAQPGTASGPIPTRTVSRPVTPPSVSDQEGTPAEEDSFQALFELYAQAQHQKSRYMQRRTALQLRYNPYLVQGFPAMVFDSMTTRMHIVGYLQRVSHEGSAAGTLTTNAQVVCCRTLPEFIADVRSDAERFGANVTAAPAEVIDEIRAQIQDITEAEKFYRRMFYGDGPRPGNAPVAFRWTDAMAYADGLTTVPIEIVGESISQTITRQRAAADARHAAANGETPSTAETSQPNAATQTSSVRADGVTSQQQQTVQHNLDPNRELSPRENIYQDAFSSYDIAMQLASRPVCTITDFIRFWHGGRTANDLMLTGDVGAPNEGFAYAEVEEQDVVAIGATPNGQPMNVRGPAGRKSAVFYARIFKLRPGPGQDGGIVPPSDAEVGYTSGPAIGPSATHAGVAENFPESRADWDAVLLAYAETVQYLLRPST